MKLFLFLTFALMISGPAQAESLSCTLSSGDQAITVTNDFSTMKNGYLFSDAGDYVFDLSHSLEGNCTAISCSHFTTLASQMYEDEFSQYSFDFPRGKKANVFKKTIEHEEEGRTYQMSCDYQP